MICCGETQQTSGGCRRLGRLLDNGSFRKIEPEWREGNSKLEDSVGDGGKTNMEESVGDGGKTKMLERLNGRWRG